MQQEYPRGVDASRARACQQSYNNGSTSACQQAFPTKSRISSGGLVLATHAPALSDLRPPFPFHHPAVGWHNGGLNHALDNPLATVVEAKSRHVCWFCPAHLCCTLIYICTTSSDKRSKPIPFDSLRHGKACRRDVEQHQFRRCS